VLSGLVGLFLCGLLTTIAVWLVASGTIRPPLPYPAVTLLFIVVFGAFSVAEIPVMVFAMHRLVVERKSNYGVVMGMNALYVSFAGVYALPVVLFTGSISGGLALSAFGIVRFAASLLRIREPLPGGPDGGTSET
jgi:heme/copper-type cytochrome/quinol oxidase subunit 4